jgi:hypothetical protein
MKRKVNNLISFLIPLIVLLILSFGIMLPFLGFYWDDWETILIGNLFPASEFWNYFNGVRPLAAWTYMVFSPLAGSSPIKWQMLSLLLRGTTALGFWWVFGLVWPENKDKIAWASLLFFVYPLFRQQAISVSYHQHWVAFSVFFLSLGCMLKSAQSSKNRWLWIIASIVTEFMHLSVMEYFIGVEFLRPLLLWVVFNKDSMDLIKKIKKIFLYWMPNLLVLVGFMAWRLWLSTVIGSDTNKPTLLFSFFSNPGFVLTQFLRHASEDSLYVFLTCWFDTISPSMFENLLSGFNLVYLSVMVFCVIAIYFLIRTFLFDKDKEISKKWIREIAIIGFTAVLLGGVPIWITDRQAYVQGSAMFSDRFLLASMLGAALLWLAIIDWAARNNTIKVTILSIMIMLCVGLQLRIANDYRWSWINQKRVYWQLYWRAPWIEPTANYLQDQSPFNYVMPTFSYHLLYHQPHESGEPIGQFFRLNPDFIYDQEAWLSGKTITSEYRNFNFSSNTKDSLVMYYHPEEENNCLWILEPEDRDHPLIPEMVKNALPLSNVSQIKQENPYHEFPDEEIFGKEPEHNWCYYYEKAALARQSMDWQTIVKLGEEAQIAGFTPADSSSNSPYEWIPFIQAYANVGQWNAAETLLSETYPTNTDYRLMLCRVWKDLADRPNMDERTLKIHDAGMGLLECE